VLAFSTTFVLLLLLLLLLWGTTDSHAERCLLCQPAAGCWQAAAAHTPHRDEPASLDTDAPTGRWPTWLCWAMYAGNVCTACVGFEPGLACRL